VGRIVGLYGVRGWVKVHSYCRPPEEIFDYRDWWIGGTPMRLAGGRPQGRGLVASLEGVTDRDAAAQLVGQDVAIPLAAMPPAGPGEYYWAELEGLAVYTRDGTALGRVSHLIETGANDVLVVRGERERLIPFLPDVVLEVDRAAGTIRVDWDPEF